MLQILSAIGNWVNLLTSPEGIFFVVVTLLVLYLTVPVILIRFVFSLKHPTTVVLFDLNNVDLPDDARRYFIQCDKGLRELGYEPAGCFGLPDLVANVQSISALFINQSIRDAALVNLMYADDGMRSSNVEFCRRYVSGGELCTNNSSILSGFKNPGNHHTNYYPGILDIEQLHKIHRCIDKDLGYGNPKLSLFDTYGGNIEPYLQQEMIYAPCDYQCQIGRFQKTPGGFGLTWKGALFMTWGQLFPFKQLQLALAKRRANALAIKLCGIRVQ